jgi:hypothetical protein
VPFQPDPLSVRYEALAGTRIGNAMAIRERPIRSRWVHAALPRPASSSARARAWLAANGVVLDTVDAGGLTTYQRAYQRALWRVAKQLGISAKGAPWCLQVQWGPDTTAGRMVSIRLVTRAEALRHVRRKPHAQRWDLTAAARSGAAESGQQKYV